MKAYVITLAVGLLVGEQIPPLAKRMLVGQAITVSAIREHCGEHVFGQLSTGRTCSGNSTPDTAPKAKTAA